MTEHHEAIALAKRVLQPPFLGSVRLELLELLARQLLRAVEEIAAHDETLAALAERTEGWKELAASRDKLLVCYRVGKQPSGKLLDRIRELKERLGE